MSVNLTGNVSPPVSIPVTGDRTQSRAATNRSADGTDSLAVAPKSPKTDSPPGVIRAHPPAPTEDMLQSLRDRELVARRGQTTAEAKTREPGVEARPEASKSPLSGTPYDPDPEPHSFDILA